MVFQEPTKRTPAPAKQKPEKGRSSTKKDNGFRLSYSASSTLLECEQKYVYSRILKVPEDPDAPDSHALSFGSAFHYVCESTMHCRTPEVPALTQEAIQIYGLDSADYYKLAACLTEYFKLHTASGLKVVACEVEVFIEGYYLAYVDAVMEAEDGGWWICDLKTAGTLNELTFKRLQYDVQLNLYASYAYKVAELVNLDIDKFQGVIYRTTRKPMVKPQKAEPIADYIRRAKVVSWSAYVRKTDLHIEETRDRFRRLFERATELKDGAEPFRNYGACGSWGRPCPYWSHCYGELFTDMFIQHLHEADQGKAAPDSILEEDDFDW